MSDTAEHRIVGGQHYRRVKWSDREGDEDVLLRKESVYCDLFRPTDVPVPEDDDSPDVLCQCGNAGFTLRYGSDEIFARCSKCGLEGSVYSG